MYKKFRILHLILLLLILFACSYKPPEDPNARPGTGLNIFPVWMDNMLGAQYGYMYSSELPVIKDARVYRPVDDLGHFLVNSYYGNEKPEFNFQFHVVDLDVVNAFALPGGNVYVFRGLIDTMGNEAELAAVMSHEMGHTVARHGTKNMSKNLLLQGALGLGTTLLGREHRGLATATYLAGSVALSLQMLKYSRDYEREPIGSGSIILIAAVTIQTRWLQCLTNWRRRTKHKRLRSPFFSVHIPRHPRENKMR